MDIITAIAILAIGITLKNWIINRAHERAAVEQAMAARLAYYAGRQLPWKMRSEPEDA